MPQMMPINWMISFFFFISIFILFNIKNYYIFFNLNIDNKKFKKLNKNKNFTWMW